MSNEGRPTLYTQELADKLCSLVAEGKSVRSICRDPNMIVTTTFFRWLREYPEFRQQYEAAKLEAHSAWFDDIVEIADNEAGQPLIVDGVPIIINGEVVMTKDSASIAHARLRVDSRKWALSKILPRKYGDRLETENRTTHDISDELKQLYKDINNQKKDILPEPEAD